MSYIQLVDPNLNAVGEIGGCLAYAEEFFTAPHIEPFATAAWNNTQFKHENMDFPAGVIVPIWFSYFATINGEYKDWGHVAARLPDGRIYSSPWQAGTNHAVLPNMSELVRIYSDNGVHPLVYLGWSEDISNVRVIKEEAVSQITKEAEMALSNAVTGSYPGADYNYQFVGEATQEKLDGLITFWSSQSQVPTLEAEVATLKAQPAPAPAPSPAPAPAPAPADNSAVLTMVKENNSLLSQLLAKLGSIFK